MAWFHQKNQFGDRNRSFIGSGRLSNLGLGSHAEQPKSADGDANWRSRQIPNLPTEGAMRGHSFPNAGRRETTQHQYSSSSSQSRFNKHPFSVKGNQSRKIAGLDISNLLRLADEYAKPAETIHAIIEGLDELLQNHTHNYQYLELLLVALGNFCKSNGCTQFTDGFVVVIQSLSNKKIFAAVPSIFLNIPTTRCPANKFSEKERIERFLQAVFHVTTELLVIMPSFGSHFLGQNFFIDLMAMKHFPSIRDLKVEHLFSVLEPANALLQNAWEQHVANKTVKTTEKKFFETQANNQIIKLEEPPDDFRTLNIMPNWGDIFMEEEPFLRPNIVVGKYPDAQTYLDVQFRLLREDYFQPLRSGLKCYVSSASGFKRRLENVRFYHDVKILSYEMDNNSHTIQFSPKHLGRVSWETSKRLIHGSLLMLSADGFKSFLLFTVSDRKPQDLELGKFKAKFEGEALPLQYKEKVYVMAESTIFFEAYRSVLESLQKISPSHFPMEDYILGRKTDAQYPDYLAVYDKNDQRDKVTYDLTCPNGDATSQIKPNIAYVDFDLASGNTSEDVSDLEEVGMQKVKLLEDVSEWPNALELGLDESQRSAYFAALTEKVAVIQGPPGTGKTYLGLRIVQTLLRNKKYWRRAPSPILVICYTNHALDQFLEGIMKFTTDIVRIGGQSKSPALAPFALFERKKNKRNDISYATKNWIGSLKEKIETYHEQRKKLWSTVSQIETDGILDSSSLFKIGIISSEIKQKFEGFDKVPLSREKLTLAAWLGLDARLEFLYYVDGAFFPAAARKLNPQRQSESVRTRSDENGQPGRVEVIDDGWDKEDIDEMQAERLGNDSERGNFLEFIYQEEAKDIEQTGRMKQELYDIEDTYLLCYDAYFEREAVYELVNELNLLEGEDADYVSWIIQEKNWFLSSLKRLLSDAPPASEREISDWMKHGLTSISWSRRWMIYSAWKRAAVKQIEDRIADLERKSQADIRQLAAIRDLESAESCKTADIVGITTVGASKHRAFVEHLKPKIVVVEEAAEVLEAHIVTSLSPSCEQLILIGDHQQLRPPTSVYKLAKDYNLDVSLFERLIRNGMKPSVLGVQHRMRPDIARLIVPAIYPTLENHSSVLTYPQVKGLSENIFFLSHKEPEMSDSDGKSHLNPYEAEMCVALARHLLLQGYEPNQITVLTTYSGQLLHLRKIRRENPALQAVRMCVVDNFQGEENDIIILSLVRSNPDESIGFLRIDNRICVALSRAKHGFYVFGNMEMLQGRSKLWDKIGKLLEESGQLGIALPLLCAKHNKKIKARKPEEFPPEGGCYEKCSKPMKCGHECQNLCHANNDPDHLDVKCSLPCTRTCPEGHNCPKLCYKDCFPCVENVTKMLPCSHEQKTFCFKHVVKVFCETVVWKILPDCEHGMDLACGVDPSKVDCPETCGKTLECDHPCPLQCHAKAPELHEKFQCKEPCKLACPENHPCPKKCFEKCGACQIKITKVLPCGHEKELPCHKDPAFAYCNVKIEKVLPNCQHTIEIECSATNEGHKCKKPCEKVLCPDEHTCHKQCYKPCGKCNKRMERELKCGHKMVLECHVDTSLVKCRLPKEETLPICGHRVTIKCGDDPATARCTMPCDVRLECGHTCVNKCHTNDDPNHENYFCKKPCQRLKKGCKQNHKCGRKCFEDCLPCNKKFNRILPCGHQIFTECYQDDNDIYCRQLVKKVIPECGHNVVVECSRLPKQDECKEACTETLACNHKCTKKCGEKCDQADCIQPVATSVTGACGHNVKVPCREYQRSFGEITEEQKEAFLMFCSEPCSGLLDCEHPCRGHCGDCLNGRVHRSCEEPCGRTLVCGHSCGVSCASSCPPCQKMCEQKCVHSKCRHRCCEPCQPCSEQCKWRCEHFRCSTKCGELCNRPPCDQPCNKVLSCLHPCVGLCGELCPPLCRVCNFEQLTEFQLLGNEGDDDARFVFLPECGHCIEVEAMDQWMNTSNDGQIQPKRCPRCKTFIHSCSRYGNIIKNTFRDITIVKRKILHQNGSKMSPAQFSEAAEKKFSEITRILNQEQCALHEKPDIYRSVIGAVATKSQTVFNESLKRSSNQKYPSLSQERRFFVQAIFDFFVTILDILKGIQISKPPSHQAIIHRFVAKPPVEPMKSELVDLLCQKIFRLVNLFTFRDRVSVQQYSQILNEVDRLDYLGAYYALQSTPSFQARGSSLKGNSILDCHLIKNVQVLTEDQKRVVKESLKSLADELKTGLGITDKERLEILAALSVQKGAWYKCPNGHIYVIGGCGGAMEQGRCNECLATIGGGSHRVISSNTFAPEMDGAARPAWPQ